MSSIYETVGKAIRELRLAHGGQGLSQAQLGKVMNVPANTISRWETGVYKPSLDDLETLARFFGVPMARYFGKEQPSWQKEALWSALEGLGETHIDEMIRYAHFKRVIIASSDRDSRT